MEHIDFGTICDQGFIPPLVAGVQFGCRLQSVFNFSPALFGGRHWMRSSIEADNPQYTLCRRPTPKSIVCTTGCFPPPFDSIKPAGYLGAIQLFVTTRLL